MSGGLDITLTSVSRGKIRAAFDGLERGMSILEIEKACERAAQPGVAALRSQVGRIGRVTGNLASSVGVKTKVYLSRLGRPTKNFGTAIALVGFQKSKSHHAHLVESGTGVRARKSAAAFSSQGTSRFVGSGKFVSRSRFVGKMPAFHPVEKAFDASASAMGALIKAEMIRLANAAARDAAAIGGG